MSWHNSTKALHDNVESFFQGKEVTLDVIGTLCKNREVAKKELDKARLKNVDLHSSSKAKIKHMSCAEDFGYKEMILIRAMELYFSRTNLLVPCENKDSVLVVSNEPTNK